MTLFAITFSLAADESLFVFDFFADLKTAMMVNVL